MRDLGGSGTSSRSPGAVSLPNPFAPPAPSITRQPPKISRQGQIEGLDPNSRPKAPAPPRTSDDRRTSTTPPPPPPAANAAAAPVLAAIGGPATGPIPGGGGPVQRNDPIHPNAAPVNLFGGTDFRPGRLRRIPTDEVPASRDYQFHFLYNPFRITINTGLNLDVTYDKADPGYNLFAGTQSIGFSLFINRQPDMIDGSADQKQRGTLRDLESLFRVLNGDPQDLYAIEGAQNLTVSARTADMGFLTGSPIEVIFGPALRYVGFVTQLDIEHKVFNTDMVPMMSEVAVSMTRLSGVTPKGADTGEGALTIPRGPGPGINGGSVPGSSIRSTT